MNGIDLHAHPVHLGLRAGARVEPACPESMDRYDADVGRHRDDGVEGRLVSLHTVARPWDTWEMPPHGSEVVPSTAGAPSLYEEHADGCVATVRPAPGQYAINDAGTWHTAGVQGQATTLFITAGRGTQHRLR